MVKLSQSLPADLTILATDVVSSYSVRESDLATALVRRWPDLCHELRSTTLILSDRWYRQSNCFLDTRHWMKTRILEQRSSLRQ
jgi:hypothetical protein